MDKILTTFTVVSLGKPVLQMFLWLNSVQQISHFLEKLKKSYQDNNIVMYRDSFFLCFIVLFLNRAWDIILKSKFRTLKYLSETLSQLAQKIITGSLIQIVELDLLSSYEASYMLGNDFLSSEKCLLFLKRLERE